MMSLLIRVAVACNCRSSSSTATTMQKQQTDSTVEGAVVMCYIRHDASRPAALMGRYLSSTNNVGNWKALLRSLSWAVS